MSQNLLTAFLFSVCLTQLQPSQRFESGKMNNTTENAQKNIVRIYPNPSYDGSINVSSNTTDRIHFYIFDLEGTMVHQIILKNRQKHTVTNLKKGVYMYDVFKDDKGIEQGKIIIK
jgi:hypothetical protein